MPVGGRTVAHYHRVTEELYFFTAGRGRHDARRRASATSARATASSSRRARSTASSTPGDEPLVLLCCCAPAYSHEDTVLVSVQAPGG